MGCDEVVGLVSPDRDAPLPLRAVGEAEVIEVGVREDECAHIGRFETDGRDRTQQVRPGLGMGGVDDREFAVLLQEVAVDVGVLEAVHSRRDISSETG
jgi:hypothetical protein